MPGRVRRPQPRTVLAVVVVAAIAIVGATAAVAATSSNGHTYRTAVVRTGSVARRLAGSGTVQAVSQAAVAFPIAGTVTAVDVAVGARVTAGQKLATLDASTLEQAVVEKQAGLAAAQLTLYKALHGEASAGSTGGARAGANTSAVRSSTTTTVAATSGGRGSAASATAAPVRVVGAQQQVDAALASVQTALAIADASCATAPAHTPTVGSGGSRGPRPMPSSTSSTSTSTTVPAAAPGTRPGTGLGSAACIAAEQQLMTGQQGLASAQQALADAEGAYDRALSSRASGATSSANASTAASGTGSTTTVTVSAAQLVADQAAVDAAATALLAAQETVAQATVTSPISGTVAAVTLQPGKHVDASSTTATVVVVGSGGWEIATSVGVADVVKLKIGDPATVTPDGGSAALAGNVAWIGAATGTTATTYPVVIGLANRASGAAAELRNGALATTSIEIARAPVAALTVPTSAVHTTNGVHLVTLLAGGKTSSVRVDVGVVGSEATQVTSGLRAGQVVVLADLHAAVPSSNTNSRIVNAITGGGTGGGALTRGFGG